MSNKSQVIRTLYSALQPLRNKKFKLVRKDQIRKLNKFKVLPLD